MKGTDPVTAWEVVRARLPAGSAVAGVDEVGRGPLVGDVVAAAVILPATVDGRAFADSKTLSPARREGLAEHLHAQAVVAIGRASPQEIDRINILAATLLAMTRAVRALPVEPALVLVDGNRLPDWPYPSLAVVRGDGCVPEIAAASIVAKVQRDREMVDLDARCPGYGFAAHKGYPTPAHLDALRRLGPLPEHRRSFRPVRDLLVTGPGE